ncbi:MAG TPA: hypothetical protein VLX91_16500 [Candidatus Acidoferrales bacterium]|nr:hypothetical protein [Candidatus Acidoferrales bacterium]
MNSRVPEAIIVLIILFAASFCRSQSGNSASAANGAHGEISIVALSDSGVGIRSRTSGFDTTAAFIGSNRSDGYPLWRIYLPHSDTLRLIVSDINESVVYDAEVRPLGTGWFDIRIYPELNLPKAAVYFLQAIFCDSTFERKFIYLK